MANNSTNTCCKMTVERDDGTTIEIVARGEFWNLIADEYEKNNPTHKVVQVEGCSSSAFKK